MKRIISFGIVMAIVGILFVWFLRSSGPRDLRPEVGPSPSQIPETQKANRPVTKGSGTSTKPPAPGEPGYAEYRHSQRRVDRHFDWKQPIDFYGKVVDENGQPVQGAVIRFSWNDLSDKGSSKAETRSDAQGLFSLRNRQGKVMTLSIEREGYDVSYQKNKFAFEYASPHEPHFHVPDPERPVLFHLRKKGPAEPLLVFNRKFEASRDGTPVEVNLRTGRQVSLGEGDIRVECWTPEQEKDAFNRYVWRCRISIPGGGLVASNEEFDYAAPLDGYAESELIEMTPEMQREWSWNATRNYFLKLPDGTYGRVEFRVVSGGAPFFRVKAAVNPSGSRNLEPGLEERVLK